MKETGIQKQPFNTIYQLMRLNRKNPEHLEKAEYFFDGTGISQLLLTGKCQNEVHKRKPPRFGKR